MTQQEAVTSWISGAKDAWDTFEKLYEDKKYHHALFFLHLALEKSLKAVIIKHTDNPPPVTHDLLRLAQTANIPLTDQKIQELSEISTFNIAARYDDEKLRFYHKATNTYATNWRTIGKQLFSEYQTLL